MNKHRKAPKKSLDSQSKDKLKNTQLQTIFIYLSDKVETASMISDATGIPQKSICRYKRDLEKRGLLKEIEKKFCKKTKFKAWYITTNPELIPVTNQLNLF
jgi:DNA-binding MarR family transcriptional regulator